MSALLVGLGLLFVAAVGALVVARFARSAEPVPTPEIVLETGASSPQHDDLEILVEADDPVRPPAVTVIPWLIDPAAHDDEPTQTGALVRVEGSGSSDRGQRRKQNEDALFVDAAQGLYIVADGMGGHRGGARASNLAVDTVRNCFASEPRANTPEPSVSVAKKVLSSRDYERAVPQTPFEGDLPRRAARVASAVSEANEAIFRAASDDPDYAGMGTTLVVAQFLPRKQRLYLGHVGDSRCYRLRDGAIELMTRDHTMEGEFGVRGAHGNRLARAVGISSGVKIDVLLARPLPGDVYLLCSDGLTKTVPTSLIGHVLSEFTEPERAAAELVTLANTNGGVDNVTAVVVRIAEPG